MTNQTYRLQATTDYCTIITYIEAIDEEQAETLGLQQIADELGMTEIDIFQSLEIEMTND